MQLHHVKSNVLATPQALFPMRIEQCVVVFVRECPPNPVIGWQRGEPARRICDHGSTRFEKAVETTTFKRLRIKKQKKKNE